MSLMIMALLSSAVSVVIAVVLAQTLMLTDTDFTMSNQDVPSRVSATIFTSFILHCLTRIRFQISLFADLVAVDTVLNTLTIDWYFNPPEDDCSNDPLVANIYLDQ